MKLSFTFGTWERNGKNSSIFRSFMRCGLFGPKLAILIQWRERCALYAIEISKISTALLAKQRNSMTAFVGATIWRIFASASTKKKRMDCELSQNYAQTTD